MLLRALLEGCTIRSAAGDLDTDIVSVEYDSRRAGPGGVFVAIRGEHADGNRFVPQALSLGCRAVVSSAPPAAELVNAVTWVQVEDEREALAVLAANYFGHPTRNLHLIGVTGTNGKTTTTYLIEAILKAARLPVAVFGTIEYRGPGFVFEAERTTPEAPDLESLFSRVVQAGWKYSAMEVSSHAIELKRVYGLHFDVSVFTNLSRDHLDFHGDMKTYFQAKKKLFSGMGGGVPRVMVLNIDDSTYDELLEIAPGHAISYGMQPAADVCPLTHRFGWDGTEAIYKTPLGEIPVRSRLMGTPNLSNMGAAIGVAVGLGISAEFIKQGLEEVPGVPGRFDSVNAGQLFRVIVDYAHTDDALEKVLVSARELTAGRLIAVFGCGGDRDRTKRPLMGEAAGRFADFAVVTSDNPRNEDPVTIIGEIVAGLQRVSGKYETEVDRRAAIKMALVMARPGDTVVIAGKGHETYQTIGSRNFQFDDRAVARELLDELNVGRNR